MISLERERFTEWLRHHGREPVGWARSHSDCPLALWIDCEYGDLKSLKSSVSALRLYTFHPEDGGSRREQELPVWAIRFVSVIDGNYSERQILADEALAILDSLQ